MFVILLTRVTTFLRLVRFDDSTRPDFTRLPPTNLTILNNDDSIIE